MSKTTTFLVTDHNTLPININPGKVSLINPQITLPCKYKNKNCSIPINWRVLNVCDTLIRYRRRRSWSRISKRWKNSQLQKKKITKKRNDENFLLISCCASELIFIFFFFYLLMIFFVVFRYFITFLLLLGSLHNNLFYFFFVRLFFLLCMLFVGFSYARFLITITQAFTTIQDIGLLPIWHNLRR